ncbi:MAG TPA: RNA polymerase sigma factor [Candidatus Saccharimonadia bacterium]|nr:RNA polymerase sigma factor [Candidatus Saccharimonadia bacterium]
MEQDETASIEAARRGDERAFRRLVEAHARALHSVCYRILGDASAAEDAVQDALVSAFRGLDRFDGRAKFSTWLHRIAVNAAIALLRARRPESSLGGDSDDGDAPPLGDALPAHDPLEQAHGAEITRRLGVALGALSPAERTAFVLRHVEQYPIEEIASVMQSNANACKQTVFRAVQKLRVALAPLRSGT